MKVLFKLLKINLINNFSLNNLFNKKKKSEKQSSSKLMGTFIVAFILFALILLYSILFSVMFAEAGQFEVIIYYGVGLGALLSLIMTLGQSYGILFQSKDFELLAVLPIKKNIIVLSKLLGLLLTNYIYFNVPFISSMVVYFVYTGFEIVYIPLVIISALLGPMLVITICSLCAFLLGRLLSGFKYKNLITGIASIAFIVVIFVISFGFGNQSAGISEEQYILDAAVLLKDVFSKAYFPSIFVAGFFNGEYINLLWFILVSLVPFVLFAWITAMNYVRINSNQVIAYKEKNFKLTYQKNGSQLKALLKKEAKVFFGSNVYFMNVIVSPVLSVIATIAVYFSVSKEIDNSITDLKTIFPLILPCLHIFIMGMTTSSSSSISMEGKQFWILKTSPVNTRNVLLAKSLFNVLLYVPFIIANFVIALILYKFTFISAFIMLLIEIIAVSTLSLLGLWVNLINYKLDWDNPSQVIKSGANTLIAMLCGFIIDFIVIISTVVCFLLDVFIPFPVLLMVIGLFIGSYFILFKNGVKRYDNIQI